MTEFNQRASLVLSKDWDLYFAAPLYSRLRILLRLALTSVTRCALNIMRNRATPKKPADTFRCLLVAKKRLDLIYFLPFAKLLARHFSCEIFLTSKKGLKETCMKWIQKHGIPIEYIDLFPSMRKEWELVAFSHHFRASLFSSKATKLFLSHGLYSGKRSSGGDYIYGHKSQSSPGRCAYTVMFAANPMEAIWSQRENKNCTQTLRFTGDLLADNLVSQNTLRSRLRTQFGVGPEEEILLVISTFGPHSLLKRMAPALLKAAQKLRSRYRIIFSAHPLNWSSTESRKSLLEISQKGFQLVPAGESWVPYLVVSDIALCDHSSLSLYYSLLLKPLLFLDMDLKITSSSGPLQALYEMCEKTNNHSPLSNQLQDAQRNFQPERVKRFIRQNYPYLGKAEERTYQTIRSLLHQRGTRTRNSYGWGGPH